MPAILKRCFFLHAPGVKPAIGSRATDVESRAFGCLFPGCSLLHQDSELLVCLALLFPIPRLLFFLSVA